MSSIFDHSLFNISHHQNNRIFIYAGHNETIYANNPRTPINNPQLKVYMEIFNRLIPDRQHHQLPPDSLRGTGACVRQVNRRFPLRLFSGDSCSSAAATSAVEAMLVEVPFEIGADLFGPLLWRDSGEDMIRDPHIDFHTDVLLEGGLSGAVARVSEEITRVVAGVQSHRGKIVAEISVVIKVVKRSIIDAELYRSLVYKETPGELLKLAAESLETVTYDGGDGDESNTSLVCSICLEKVLSGTQVTRLPCSHRFHENCFVPWLNKSMTCPLCRFNLLDKHT